MGKLIGKIVAFLFITGSFGAVSMKTIQTIGLDLDKNLLPVVAYLSGLVLYCLSGKLPKLGLVLYRALVMLYGYMLFFNKPTHVPTVEKIVVVATIIVVLNFIAKIRTIFKARKPNLDEVGQFASDSKTFYASLRWKKTRLNILQNTPKYCAVCGTGNTDSWHVDHILPRSIFPSFALSLWNLRRLCPDCNTGKSNQVTTHEIKDLYRNFRNQAEIVEFEAAVNKNPNYKRILENANRKTVA